MNGTLKTNLTIAALLKHAEAAALNQFIIQYASMNKDFENALMDNFGPKSTLPAEKQHYEAIIVSAFSNNEVKSGSRYSRGWDDYWHEAGAVAADLRPLLDKAEYYQQFENFGEAMCIYQALIDTIPDEWNPDFDHEGDVQVVYDEAIKQLQAMMEKKLLTIVQKQSLFEWFEKERNDNKYEYVGLDTNLRVLESYFSDTPEMLQHSLTIIEERIKAAHSDYEIEKAAMAKIHLLQHAGLTTDAEHVIHKYIRFNSIRILRFEELMEQKLYAKAIPLIRKGLKLAQKEKYPDAFVNWKERLLRVYQAQNNVEKILETTEELFADSWTNRKAHYELIKALTPKSEWPATLENLLEKLGTGANSFSDLKAEILIEHKMWDRLFAACREAGATTIEKYENHLLPLFPEQILDVYHQYVEKQSLISDNHAYENTARVLQKMKKYEGGQSLVEKLLVKYRELYKRRSNMMKALEEV